MRRIVLALIVLVLVDSGLGALLRIVYGHVYTGDAAGGVNGTLAAVDKGVNVLLLGSSTASHGYDPREMEPVLGVEVYNAGSNGMWYDYVYGLMRLASASDTQAKLPSVWVLNLDFTTLFQDLRSAGKLAPRMDEDPVVRKLVENTVPNPVERLRFHSKLVRYNGMALSLGKQLVRPESSIQGYLPLHGTVLETLDDELGIVPSDKPAAYPLQMLQGLSALAAQQGAQLVLVVPPAYLATDAERQTVANMLGTAREIAHDLNVPLLDYTPLTVPEFTNPNLYRDKVHLNHEGARVLSQLVARGLQPYL